MDLSAKDPENVRKMFHQLLREVKRVESYNDPEKANENRKKKNVLEWFLTKRPTRQELIDRKILPSDFSVREFSKNFQ